MPAGIKARLATGEKIENYGHGTQFFESGKRRAQSLMCDGCVRGQHHLCASEECPCVCNDSDFRWSRKTNRSETQREMATIIAVRPELRSLFQ